MLALLAAIGARKPGEYLGDRTLANFHAIGDPFKAAFA
jgi:hypothetical protein